MTDCVIFEDLKSKTLVSVEIKHHEEILFTTDDGEVYKLYHFQDCYESVMIDDVCGNLDDLIGSPLLVAEEFVSEDNTPEGFPVFRDTDSFTWSFYELGTIKGDVTIRWYGESNGYYSELVDFRLVK